MYSQIQKTVHSGAPPQTYSITVSDQPYYEYYYGRRATLSIGDALPLRGILEGTIIFNVEHHIGDYGALPRASRDYAIIISRNPDNGVWAGGVSHRGKAATNDGKADDARHLPVPSSFGSNGPFLAKAACTISSTLDDLQLDITL